MESKCRICSQYEETVDHIASGCEVLAKTEYIYRHHNAADGINMSQTVMHNKDSNILIIWDMPVNTDRTITANRPEIVVKDSMNSTSKPIDMAVPSDRNIALREMEKKSKYKDLELEIQKMRHMKP